MKDEWIRRMGDGCRLVLPTCLYYQIVTELVQAIVGRGQGLTLRFVVCFALLQLQQGKELSFPFLIWQAFLFHTYDFFLYK